MIQHSPLSYQQNVQHLINKFLEDVRAIDPSKPIPAYCHNQVDSDKVYYSGPSFDDNELAAAIKAIITGKWLSSGEKVREFEDAFSVYLNEGTMRSWPGYSVMVNSGSSANLVMLAALKHAMGWKDGAEVIVSSVGFPTTVSAIIQNNLKPVFVDIEYDTLNFNLDDVKKAINSNTVAIFISPVLGNPPDLNELQDMSFCNQSLVLDSCDSLGTKWDNMHINNYAVASSYSFYPAHHITTGEGGMVTSPSSQIIEAARSIAWWGRACYCVGQANLLSCGTCKNRFSRWIPELGHDIDHKYVFDHIGYNLKPLDLQGAIGLEQLAKIPTFESVRRFNFKLITDVLYNVKGVKPITVHPKADVCWFGVPVICESGEMKTKFVKHLESNGIQTRNYFAGNLLVHPAYKHLDDWKKYPNANQVLEKVFFIGCAQTITPFQIFNITQAIESF